MSEQDSDRSEAATPYKLEEARRKGTVAKSTELATAGVLCVLVAFVFAYGAGFVDRLKSLARISFAIDHRITETVEGISHLMQTQLGLAIDILSPALGAIVVVVVFAQLIQTGPILSTDPAKPNWARLNPAEGLKRLFSVRILFEFGKTTLKLACILILTFNFVHDALPKLASLSELGVNQLVHSLCGIAGDLLLSIAAAALGIAICDFCFVKWEFSRRMRMSKRDIRDEVKNREGDPRIKSRLRQLRTEMFKRVSSLKKVPGSSVLITNPTRLAIAVGYEQGVDQAPRVVAKGAGALAALMREIARRHRVPVLQDKSLARSLFREVDFEQEIPERHYARMARILAWAFKLKAASTRGAST